MAGSTPSQPRDSADRTVARLPSIVVVDDDAVSARLVTRFLERLRLCNPILTAGSVAAAVEAVRGLEAPPVLLLLDLNLGDGSGFDIIRQLGPSVLGRAAVVVLTGSDELEDVDEAYSLGVQSYLVKPVAFEALGDIIRRVELAWALLDPGEEAKP